MPKILASTPAENLLLMFSFGRNVLGMLFILDRFLDNYFSLDVVWKMEWQKSFFHTSQIYISVVYYFLSNILISF